eukprot:756811-Hanusia_phi.AAC.7
MVTAYCQGRLSPARGPGPSKFFSSPSGRVGHISGVGVGGLKGGTRALIPPLKSYPHPTQESIQNVPPDDRVGPTIPTGTFRSKGGVVPLPPRVCEIEGGDEMGCGEFIWVGFRFNEGVTIEIAYNIRLEGTKPAGKGLVGWGVTLFGEWNSNFEVGSLFEKWGQQLTWMGEPNRVAWYSEWYDDRGGRVRVRSCGQQPCEPGQTTPVGGVIGYSSAKETWVGWYEGLEEETIARQEFL